MGAILAKGLIPYKCPKIFLPVWWILYIIVWVIYRIYSCIRWFFTPARQRW